MKKALVALFLLMGSHSAFAGNTFECRSVDENQPYDLKSFSINLSRTKAFITWDIGPSQTTEKASVDPSFSPTPSSALAGFERFDITTSRTQFPDAPISEIYFESKLVNGGYRLRTGAIGGFAKIMGWGYRYAKYVCQRD